MLPAFTPPISRGISWPIEHEKIEIELSKRHTRWQSFGCAAESKAAKVQSDESVRF